MSWEIFLAHSETLELIADITNECTEKSLQLALNRPGNFNFTLPLFTEWKDFLNPVEHCVIASKNKNIVWSGPLWTKSESFSQEKINISTVGWFQILNKRYFTDANHTYNSTNEGEIAFQLLDYANTQEIDGILRPTWITRGFNTSEGTRDRTYNRWQNIGQEIVNLTEIESGFDFTIDPATREMNIKNWDEYVDNTSAVFGFNFGPSNTTEVSRNTNADDLFNQIYVVGQYGTPEAHETADIDRFNLHQNVININEISDISILGAIANAELAVNSKPRTIINFDPKGGGMLNVPSFFEDYNLGDKVYLTAKRDDAEILNQAIRVFGLTLNVDNNGVEKISSLETTAQSG